MEIFQIFVQADLTGLNLPDFTPSDVLIVPSAYYYYLSFHGNPIPLPNNIGTPEEQEMSKKIWLAMTTDKLFPLDCAYAVANKDQLKNPKIPSYISLSVKDRQRQLPSGDPDFFEERLQWIISQVPKISVDTLLRELHMFPPNPSADIYKVATMLMYLDESNYQDIYPLKKYLADLGVVSLENVNLQLYPLYELFFLATRFYSRPISETQQGMLKFKTRFSPGSAGAKFIDNIFYYEIYDWPKFVQIIETLEKEGPLAAGILVGTHFEDWPRWSSEYLSIKRPKIPVQNLADTLAINFPKFQTWTDDELVDLLTEYNIPVPDRAEFFFRGLWVEHLICVVKKFVLNINV